MPLGKNPGYANVIHRSRYITKLKISVSSQLLYINLISGSIPGGPKSEVLLVFCSLPDGSVSLCQLCVLFMLHSYAGDYHAPACSRLLTGCMGVHVGISSRIMTEKWWNLELPHLERVK